MVFLYFINKSVLICVNLWPTAFYRLIQNWQDAGLLKPSAIKPAISTIEQSLVLKKIGKLSLQDVTLLETVLKELLDLRTK